MEGNLSCEEDLKPFLLLAVEDLGTIMTIDFLLDQFLVFGACQRASEDSRSEIHPIIDSKFVSFPPGC